MPTYEFEDVETGAVVEAHFPMSEAPKLGEELMLEGQLVRRIVSSPALDMGLEFPIRSYQIDAKEAGVKSDGHGHAVFESAKEVREYCARTGATNSKLRGMRD